jgi:phage regulator Rha-like protein
MSNQTEVQVFENHYLQAFKQLSEITKTKKQLEEQEKKVKADLEKAMDEHEIKSIDNQFLKITRVAASSSTSIDLKTLEEKEPELHKELLEDYPKVTNRKSYLTFKVK